MFGSKPRLKMARPSDGNQIDREPTPAGGEFVQHLPGLFDGRARNLFQAFAKTGRRQQFRFYQSWRLVLRAQQAQLDAFDCQARAADDESREFPWVFGDRRLVPLLAQFGHLRGVTGHYPGPRRILLQNPLLQDLRRPVGIASGEKRDDLGARGQATGHPEHAHRNDRPVVVGLQLLDESRQGSRRRVVVGR